MADHTAATELTVVVTAHNRADVIDETLASIAEQRWDGDWDLLLLDNDSTDATPEILHRWADEMPVPTRVVAATERHNPSYARNTAVAATDAASVAFVDDDDVIGEGWVAAIGDALRTHELVASRHDYRRLNDPAQIKDRVNQTTALSTFHGTPVVSGGGLGCRRSLWNAVGGSNEAFRTGQDIDFALRVAAHGDVEPVLVDDAEYSVRLRSAAAKAFGQGERMGRAEVRLRAAHTPDAALAADAGRRWARRWLALALRIRGLGSEANRRRWAFDVGHEIGRLRGMVVHRTWAP